MPRSARITLPNYPHHIIQRGHNRQLVFAETADYRYYLDNLADWKTAFNCKVYAYCLMTNHAKRGQIYLLTRPRVDSTSKCITRRRTKKQDMMGFLVVLEVRATNTPERNGKKGRIYFPPPNINPSAG